MTKTRHDFGTLLREHGFKATTGRVALLEVLKKAGRPVSIATIHKSIGKDADQATIYRAVEALAESGIVRRVDLQNGHSEYEFIEGEAHHHHLVCEKCGKIEDVVDCEPGSLEKMVLKNSRTFKEIRTHSLEFFGTCNACSRK